MRADPEREDLADERMGNPPHDDLPREAEATAELSGRGMRRRGVVRWLLLGGIRVTYRLWTRVAARVFPEGSLQERLAGALGIPLPDRLNLSWITPQLAVGGRIHPRDIPRLADIGVTAVVDTRSEHRDDEAALAAHGIQLLYLPAPDTYPLTIQDLCAGTTWITRQLAAGHRVLVHCEHGVGRSVLLTAAALVAGGMNADEAIRLVQSQRWQAAPNHRQLARLQEFERFVRAGGPNACQ
ncbi:MAG TPA: dual specificity protein phosphatase [Ktedonobacterales bacterium]|jgi:protein tyrosine phosphatase (PTP) superfamily phosphohydrolase (DUF442 family)